ncbi:hypothetical protein TNCV_1902431 [Trichonephila clavipes]|nr:hypothetical protein TNCV_1902431 [Trichonephila clavipes]
MYLTIYVTVASSTPRELVSFAFPELAPPHLQRQTPDRFEWIPLVFPHNQSEFQVAGCPASILFNCFKFFLSSSVARQPRVGFGLLKKPFPGQPSSCQCYPIPSSQN